MPREAVRVLLVDDNPDDVSIIRRLLLLYRRVDFKVAVAYSANSGLQYLLEHGADLVLLDYAMPSEDGLSFLRRAAAQLDLPPVIMITGQSDYRIAAEAVRSGVSDCISKHSMTSQALGFALQTAIDRSRHQRELAQFDERVTGALVAAARSLDPTYAGERIAHYAGRLGEALALNSHQLELLRSGALLHDIGNLGLRPELLTRPGVLTEPELEEMRYHPIIGERICSSLNFARDLCPILRHHHERWDGEGYVDGLKGEEIPLFARIVAVADAYDAMTQERPHHLALTGEEALANLRAGAGAQWDPQLVELFVPLATETAEAGALEK